MKFIEPYYKTNFGRKLEVTPLVPSDALYDNEYIFEIFVKHNEEISPSFKKLRRAFVFDTGCVNFAFCPNIEKIYCNKTGLLDIGPYRPEVIGKVTELIFEGKFVEFKNLVKKDILIRK